MRYIDKLMAEHPDDFEIVDEGDIQWVNVFGGCPFDYGYCLNKDLPCDDHDQGTDDDPYSICHRCWHREIPKEDTTTAYDWADLAMGLALEIVAFCESGVYGNYSYELKMDMNGIVSCLKNAMDKMKQEGNR